MLCPQASNSTSCSAAQCMMRPPAIFYAMPGRAAPISAPRAGPMECFFLNQDAEAREMVLAAPLASLDGQGDDSSTSIANNHNASSLISMLLRQQQRRISVQARASHTDRQRTHALTGQRQTCRAVERNTQGCPGCLKAAPIIARPAYRSRLQRSQVRRRCGCSCSGFTNSVDRLMYDRLWLMHHIHVGWLNLFLS